MAVIERFLDFFFGAGGSVKETVEIFRENAEASAERHHQLTQGAREQFGKEFQHSKASIFDRVIDGLNRLPRPALAFGTLGLFVAAMVDPIWFAERMGGMALVPEPLWWLLGAIVSFYFGARHQLKSQQFQKSLGQTYARAESFRTKRREEKAASAATPVAGDAEPNPALVDWRQRK